MLGVLVFIGILLALVLVHEWGHFAAARRLGVSVEEFGFGFPPRAWAKKIKGTEYSINWLPLGGFVRLKGEDTAIKAPDSFSAQSPYKRGVIVVAGIVMNLLLATILLAIVSGVGFRQDISQGLPNGVTISKTEHAVVAIVSDSPALNVLEVGDKILAIDNNSFGDLPSLQNYIKHATGAMVVSVERNGEIVDETVTPALIESSEIGAFYGLGIQLQSSALVQVPWTKALGYGTKLTVTAFTSIATTFYTLFTGAFFSGVTTVDVAGPIGIAAMTGNIVDMGWVVVLQFAALLSINLAFINLLPIPALDGGRLAFIVIEIIRRKPISSHYESVVHRVGFTLLLLLIISVTVLDVSKLLNLIW